MSIRTRAQMALFLMLSMMLISVSEAVILDDENRIEIILDDQTNVILYGLASRNPDRKTRKYYALPSNLHLTTKEDGVTPEFLFNSYVTNKSKEQGGISGAIMHFLVSWGLTTEQEKDLSKKLKKKFKGAKYMGPVPLEIDDKGGSFKIVSATLGSDLAPKLVTSGKAPLIPGGKAAAASQLTAEGAQLMASTFEADRSITDVSIVFDYNYRVLAPAARGYILIDWSKINVESERMSAEYKKWQSGTKTKSKRVCVLVFCGSSSKTKPTYSRSYDEMRSEYEYMREKKYIKVVFDQLRGGEATQKMQDAFFQFFLNMVTEKSDPDDGIPPPPSEKEKDKMPNIKYGNSYKYSKSFTKISNKSGTTKLVLRARTAVTYPIQLVGNLASWYDGVRDNPKCVYETVLDNPFFQHRDIRFILDLDAKDIFDEAINYVTVDVTKPRATGRPFEDRITIDKKFLEEKGVTANVTYSRGSDAGSDLYQYQVQWGLRGGEVYPNDEEVELKEGSWEAVSLAPPVRPRVIEVESDLDELEASDISRATIQIHYPRFGKEVEQNIHISPAQGEALVSQRIFTDKDAEGYIYRVIFNHKRDGKLALPWTARVSDDYIYVNIPEELLVEEENEFKTLAKEAAKTIATSASEKVLDKFEELLGGN